MDAIIYPCLNPNDKAGLAISVSKMIICSLRYNNIAVANVKKIQLTTAAANNQVDRIVCLVVVTATIRNLSRLNRLNNYAGLCKHL